MTRETEGRIGRNIDTYADGIRDAAYLLRNDPNNASDWNPCCRIVAETMAQEIEDLPEALDTDR